MNNISRKQNKTKVVRTFVCVVHWIIEKFSGYFKIYKSGKDSYSSSYAEKLKNMRNLRMILYSNTLYMKYSIISTIKNIS